MLPATCTQQTALSLERESGRVSERQSPRKQRRAQAEELNSAIFDDQDLLRGKGPRVAHGCQSRTTTELKKQNTAHAKMATKQKQTQTKQKKTLHFRIQHPCITSADAVYRHTQTHAHTPAVSPIQAMVMPWSGPSGT